MDSDSGINKHFYKIVALHEEKNLKWEDISLQVPMLSRGWFELSRLPKEDRVEFTEQYWFAKLPFKCAKGIFLEEKLKRFFEKVEDVSVFMAQEREKGPYDVHMVYSLKNDEAFFQGGPPANEESIINLTKQFESVHFPEDYLSFLTIHDGFSKYVDTGLIKTRDMAKSYLKFQDLVLDKVLLASDNMPIPPSTLIPFYESENLHSYQCFYTEWFPEEEMGNVSYDYSTKQKVSYLVEEGISYKNFLSWLLEYLKIPNV